MRLKSVLILFSPPPSVWVKPVTLKLQIKIHPEHSPELRKYVLQHIEILLTVLGSLDFEHCLKYRQTVSRASVPVCARWSVNISVSI